jgi:hypothetical protein
MKTEEVKPKEEKIEKSKPQKYYQLFYKSGLMWYPSGQPEEGEIGKENIERNLEAYVGSYKNTEYKLISYEI